MTTYNAAAFLAEALDSVVDQTFRDFELVLLDDASTDNSFAMLQQYADRDDRIRLARLDDNTGVAASHNVAIRLTNAPIVAVADADDINDLRRFELQLKAFDDHPDVDVVGSHHLELHDDSGDLFVPRRGTRGIVDGMQPAPHSTLMMRRRAFEAVDGYDESFALSEDHDLLQRMANNGSQIHVVAAPLVTVRRHPGNATRPDRRLVDVRAELRILWRLFRAPNLTPSRAAFGYATELVAKWAFLSLRLDRIVDTRRISRLLGRGPTPVSGATAGSGVDGRDDDGHSDNLDA